MCTSFQHSSVGTLPPISERSYGRDKARPIWCDGGEGHGRTCVTGENLDKPACRNEVLDSQVRIWIRPRLARVQVTRTDTGRRIGRGLPFST